MIRSDTLGVSSVIRDLSIGHNHYASMMQFFRASSWNIDVLRTKSKKVVSEATVACYLAKSIFSFIEKSNNFSIGRIIKKKQVDPLFYEDQLAS